MPTRNPWLLALVPVAVVLLAGASSVQFTTPHGTLVVETDDPAVKVSLDGQDLKVTGAGPSEIRLAVGPHLFRTEQPGKPPREELLSVSNGGRVVVRVRAGTPAKPARPRGELIREARNAAGELVGLRDDIDNRVWAVVSNGWTKAEAAKLLLTFHRGPGELPGFPVGADAVAKPRADLAKLRERRATVFGLWAEVARQDAGKPGANPLWGVWDVAGVRGAGGVAADSLDLFDPDPVGRRLAFADGGAALNTGAGYWGFGSAETDGPGTIDLDVPVRGDTVFRGRYKVEGDKAVLRLNPINAPRPADPDGDPTDGGFVLVLRRATATVASAAGPMVSPGGELPRYRLTPGQEINYRFESTFKFGEGKNAGEHRSREEWTGWVLRTNPDGSSRILIREVDNFISVRNGKESPNQSRTMFVYADVFPDGRISSNSTIISRGRPTAYFPRLPKDAAEAASGWATSDDGKTVTAKPAGENRFSATTVDPMDKIYLSTHAVTVTFDPVRGLISRAETAYTQGYGFKGKGIGTVELVGVKSLTPDELSALSADADRYFAATEVYLKEVVAAEEKLPPDQIRAALDRAAEAVKTAAEAVVRPELKAELVTKVKSLDQEAKYFLAEAQRRAKIVGKPAFVFAATDMDEKPVALDDLKGKVLVLDFWYRGCGWCIKAMPQINQLAGDFAGEPVAVVGMNTDSDKADAEFVIREMGLKYPTLRIKHELSEKFGVRGFPTLVLIDKKGVVRDLHVGYSATLREDVGKAVRGLLAEE